MSTEQNKSRHHGCFIQTMKRKRLQEKRQQISTLTCKYAHVIGAFYCFTANQITKPRNSIKRESTQPPQSSR